MRALALLAPLALVALGARATAPTEDEFAYCTTCHGTQGNGNPAIRAPKIAGIASWYLERQLKAFRADIRGTQDADEPGHEMRPVAVALPDDRAVARAVAYVQTFTAVAPPVTVHGDQTRGATLYALCAGCHGERAEGNETLLAPPLAAQNDWYLVAQLKAYRDGRRGTQVDDVTGAAMRATAVEMTDAAMDDVVTYIVALH